MNDLRSPIGYFFALLGVILCGVSVLDPGARAPLTQANVNLYAGLAMAAFGGTMLWLAGRAK